MDNNEVEEHDVNRRMYYRRSLGERTPLIELITVCYCIVAYVRRLTCDKVYNTLPGEAEKEVTMEWAGEEDYCYKDGDTYC